MAGHSQFKNIMHRKGAQDAKRAKMFNKIAREIMVACKSGAPDPSSNPRLRAAILSGRAVNMPRERIERAMAAALDAGANEAYESVRYEGRGPGGAALIVEALTDNRNRTVPDLRTAFSKHGGAMGESNSAAFLFNRCGGIYYAASAGSVDAMLEAGIEAGADNVESDADAHVFTTSVEDFAAVRDALEARFGAAMEARLEWRAHEDLSLPADAAETLRKLIDVLEDHDDVQNVWTNAVVS